MGIYTQFQHILSSQELAKEKETKDELQQERNSYAQKCARITSRETNAAVAAAEREERLKSLTLELRQDLANAAATSTNVSSLLAAARARSAVLLNQVCVCRGPMIGCFRRSCKLGPRRT